jgi:hypothetical protein
VTAFPYGYTGSPQGMGLLLTWDELMAKSTVNRLHPEFLRRVRRLCEYAARDGVPLGVGTGWRVQPSGPNGSALPGFAKPGNSNHESFPAGSGAANAVAADMVPNTAWPWLQQNCISFGLRTFANVNNEPWHIQPAEITASRNWRTAPWDLDEIDLPPAVDDPAPGPDPGQVGPPPPPPPPPPAAPTLQVTTLNIDKTTLDPALRDQLRGNDDVQLFQVMCLGLYQLSGNDTFNVGNADKDYGPRCQAAARLYQALNGLEQDAVFGPKSWTKALNG